MKKIAVLILSSSIFAACGGEANRQTIDSNAVPPPAVQNSNNVIISSHSTDKNTAPTNANVVPKSATKTKWTQSGNPIDTSQFDAGITQAEKDLKAKPNDETAKKSLAAAYVNRGLALTEARQYASALGDYRRAQKLDPANEDAKKWIAQIIGIYDSINKDYPKDGEEPPPLPFKKS